MALALLTTTAFERDLKRVGKQGKSLDKLETVVNLLQGTAAFAGPVPSASIARKLGRALGLPY